ncbi:MAG TPA: malto-oligosyltrehalose synthase [Thermoanaerobaculia bacterium]|nr:malto-oligosyltrehalose synthase [Thermoanaerobaculia bacterium]
MYRSPLATYRLQFNASFTFNDARTIVPYLAELGITDIYSSPILKARKGSTHGYDVVDADALNPELGTQEDFEALQRELRARNIGFLLDIVPNHMAASPENAWWMTVLENGINSRYRDYFDIDWRGDKVLLPILGRPYGETLEAGEITLRYDTDGFAFDYYDKRFPLAPQTYPDVLRGCIDVLPAEGIAIELRDLVVTDVTVPNSKFLKETLARIHESSAEFRDVLAREIARINADADALDALLEKQWYRLAYWRIAGETINYRRFFDITDLVGVRIEIPEVFEARNRLHLEAIARGEITGLRVDHIDGLHDPLAYLRKLQLRLAEPDNGEFYVVVEKILAHDETLPPTFPVAGTSGYDFIDTLNALFVDPAGLARLDESYRAFTGITDSFDDICYQRKKQVIHDLFPGEMRSLGALLADLAATDRNARDFAPSELLAALIEITACLRVYRTYIREHPVSDTDRRFLCAAIGDARRRESSLDGRLFAFLERVLLVERDEWLPFVMRWQQFTGRVMAKGVEDTSFYVFNRLVSLNEVGGHPGRTNFDPIAEFHARNERIARDWPDTLNATSTHDTKRSEDVRARISVLSEIPDEWRRRVRRWSSSLPVARRPLPGEPRTSGDPRATGNGQQATIDPNMEWLIYQTLIGAWPIDAQRLRQYVEKAAREAKTHTSWVAPNAEYENALLAFAESLLESRPFLRLHKRVAYHGHLNALAQLVLKITSPGAPDLYQGTELWDYSLVDPDNRRPVDYAARAATLRKLHRGANLATLQRRWSDGRIKFFTTWRALAVRARHAETFRRGAYRPLPAGEHCVAFLRGDDILVAVRRLTTRECEGAVEVPQGTWRNAFTEEVLEGGRVEVGRLFAALPVAIFERA